MKIALAQLDPTVGDIEGNARLVLDAMERSRTAGARLIVFAELVLAGYPPLDLLFRDELHRRIEAVLPALSAASRGLAAVIGLPRRGNGGTFNSAALLVDGRLTGFADKSLLPTYDVFDERRYFSPAAGPRCFSIGGIRCGVTICEDIWSMETRGLPSPYPTDPVDSLASEGIDLLLNLSASPFELGKRRTREDILRRIATRCRVPAVYVNQVGANDELIFDGRSFAVDREGRPVVRCAGFAPDLQLFDTDAACSGPVTPSDDADAVAEVRAALVCGIAGFARKCGFRGAVLGLSGGIDSAVCCALACEALGSGNVTGVAMPGPFSSLHSVDDARALAGSCDLGHFLTLPVTGIFGAFRRTLAGPFDGLPFDTTEENLQARIRGTLLMAFANKHGLMLLATGNKSELATGYCTLYGDMAGALAPIGDLPKTAVYNLARRINADAGRPLIPESTLEKPPSAELRPNQTDQDSLPPYDLLDLVLAGYIEAGLDAQAIRRAVAEPDLADRIARLVDRSEFKRRQAPPVLKVTSKAFGSGRRFPIAQGFRR